MSENVLDANRENCAYRGNKHQTTKQEKRSKKDPLEKKKILEKKMGYKFLRTTTKREKLLC